MKKRSYIFNFIIGLALGFSIGSFFILTVITDSMIYGVFTYISIVIAAFSIANELDKSKNKNASEEK